MSGPIRMERLSHRMQPISQVQVSTIGEDVQGTEMNVMVTYVPLVDRGEPLSSFERLMVYKLDSIFASQREYFELIESRFQHLDN